jgi:hypothetical protein
MIDFTNLFQPYNIHHKPCHPGNPDILAVFPELSRRYEARLAQQSRMAGERPHYQQEAAP